MVAGFAGRPVFWTDRVNWPGLWATIFNGSTTEMTAWPSTNDVIRSTQLQLMKQDTEVGDRIICTIRSRLSDLLGCAVSRQDPASFSSLALMDRRQEVLIGLYWTRLFQIRPETDLAGCRNTNLLELEPDPDPDLGRTCFGIIEQYAWWNYMASAMVSAAIKSQYSLVILYYVTICQFWRNLWYGNGFCSSEYNSN